MKTLRYKQVGERLIFEKFDVLPIDPEMTRIANQQTLAELPEQVAASQKIAEKFGHEQARRRIERTIRVAQYNQAKGSAQIITEESKKLETTAALITCCNNDLNALNANMTAKRKQIIKGNPIYSHPRKNEIQLTDAEEQGLRAMLATLENEQIELKIKWSDQVVISEAGKEPVTAPSPELVGYQKIADLRGVEYFWKAGDLWEYATGITELGVVPTLPGGAIEKSDLTPEQAEEIRVQGLSGEEKEIEKTSMLAANLSRAAMMKVELDIQGDADSLPKSQAWHQEQIAVIEQKYK